MAGVRVETVDTTESTVSSTTTERGLVDLDVRNDKVLDVEALGVSVSLGVVKKLSDQLDGLNRPAGVSETELLALGGSANGTVVLAERNGTLLLGNSGEVLQGSLELLTSNGLSSGLSVLEANTKVRSTSGSSSGRVDGGLAVTSHLLMRANASAICVFLSSRLKDPGEPERGNECITW